jgi:hypothetical protein
MVCDFAMIILELYLLTWMNRYVHLIFYVDDMTRHGVGMGYMQIQFLCME